MKKLLFILFVVPLTLFSQDYTTNDDLLLKDVNAKYIIVSKPNVFNKKTYVYLDYGQEFKSGISAQAIKLKGKKIKFSSILNVINILDNYKVINRVDNNSDTSFLLLYSKDD